MNPVVLYFASGESLYSGAGLILLAIVISQYKAQSRMLRLRNVAAWLGLTFMVMACPPFSWTVDAMFIALFVLWLTFSNRRLSRRTNQWRTVSSTISVIVVLTLTGVELSHRRMPSIVGTPSDRLVVIGDSISSGIDPRVPTWPTVMQQITGAPVKSLSRPGAQSREGPGMAEEVAPDDHLILIELGGNDLLGGVPSVAFENNLNATLSKLATLGRTIVMFELPLWPDKIDYGQIQRRLAAKYGVWL